MQVTLGMTPFVSSTEEVPQTAYLTHFRMKMEVF